MEKIKELGSITKAAKAMDMSYRHAWRLIDSMNQQTPHPFVITSMGGRRGGGSVVTPHGERAIVLFKKFNEEFNAFLKDKSDGITFEETS